MATKLAPAAAAGDESGGDALCRHVTNHEGVDLCVRTAARLLLRFRSGKQLMALQGTAFFGDNDGRRVVAIDLAAWTCSDIATGDGAYPVDQVSPTHVLASTRRETAVTAIAISAPHQTSTVQLQEHAPRSTTKHPKRGLALVSGADRVMTSVLEVSSEPFRVLEVVGSGESGSVRDFGGPLATGHPYWLDDDSERFFQLDRINRRLEVYRVGDATPLAGIDTPTSVHEVTRVAGEQGRWYAVCEGNPGDDIPPSLLVIDESGNGLTATANVPLPVPAGDRRRMGGHHVDRHPDGLHFYFGSAEGRVYLIDRRRLTIAAELETGLGHGHTRVAPQRGLAVSTNHDDSFVTVFDVRTNRKLKDIQVSSIPAGSKRKRQGHTSAIDREERFFFHTASSDGLFYAIDLDSLQVAKTLDVGGYPIQGTFVWK